MVLLGDFDVDVIASWRVFLRAAAWGINCDVVLVDSFGRHALWALALSRKWGCPLVVRTRGDVFQEYQDVAEFGPESTFRNIARFRGRAGARVAAACLGRADTVLANSKYARDRIAVRFPELRFDVVHNPYTPPKDVSKGPCQATPAGEPRSYRVLSVTGFAYWRKVSLLYRALSDWVDPDFLCDIDAEWRIYGDGLHLQKFQTLVDERQLGDRVKLMGFVSDPRPAYVWSQVFVHLTQLDAFPNVTLEAMAHSRPIITNADSCGTLEQVADCGSGRIISSRAEFRQALIDYAADPDLRRAHGDHGHQRLTHHFTPDALKPRMFEAMTGSLLPRERSP